MPLAQADIHARVTRHRLWRHSWVTAGVVFILSWLYQLGAYDSVSFVMLSKVIAGTAGVLIAASFALSGFCYYFDFLDSKLGYRKYLGLIGFYLALTYSVLLIFIYPELYGPGLFKRLGEIEVLLGFAAMAILTFMAIISSTKMMHVLGPKRWRQCLRLGYLAMLLLVWRGWELESELWLGWLRQPAGLPPGRLVLSVIIVGVFTLRAAMILSQQWHHRDKDQLRSQFTISS